MHRDSLAPATASVDTRKHYLWLWLEGLAVVDRNVAHDICHEKSGAAQIPNKALHFLLVLDLADLAPCSRVVKDDLLIVVAGGEHVLATDGAAWTEDPSDDLLLGSFNVDGQFGLPGVPDSKTVVFGRRSEKVLVCRVIKGQTGYTARVLPVLSRVVSM